MRTVPIGVAATLLAGREDLRAALRACGRQVGARVEVDATAAAHAAGQAVAQALHGYAEACELFWGNLATGPAAVTGAGFVLARRPVLSHQQVTGKKGRADLVEVFDDLTAVSGLSQLLEQLTAADPDLGMIDHVALTLGGRAHQSEPGAVVATALWEGACSYPQSLGGLPWPGEVRRAFTLTARQAAWRDRRVRRLARVDVAVDELWPDPAPWAATLPPR